MSLSLWIAVFPDTGTAAPIPWTLEEKVNSDGPGRMVIITHQDRPIVRLVFGEGQMKPFLHVYGEEGELLTNPGLDPTGKTTGQFPHHRGLFIGWKIQSDLGAWDLWHMNRGGDIRVVEIEKKEALDSGVHLLTRNEWRAGKEDDAGSSLLLTEWRDMRISKPARGRTQIDLNFRLLPARDLQLAGDLQHSGVHFRAANEVAGRAKETSYLQEPDGLVKGHDLKWCELLFPIGERWYTALQMNGADNPVEELSMRNYGRFGYFFKRDLKKDQALDLQYRFIIAAVDPPDHPPQRSPERQARDRKAAQASYEEFLASLRH